MDNHFKRHNMKSRVIAFVHDSITNDVHPGEFIENLELLKFAMKTLPEQMDWIMCPLGVDLEISDNLGESAALGYHVLHPDKRFEMELSGYSHVIDNIVNALKWSYPILEDTLLSEKIVVEEDGDLIARKVLNLSFSNQTFLDQKRKIVIQSK